MIRLRRIGRTPRRRSARARLKFASLVPDPAIIQRMRQRRLATQPMRLSQSLLIADSLFRILRRQSLRSQCMSRFVRRRFRESFWTQIGVLWKVKPAAKVERHNERIWARNVTKEEKPCPAYRSGQGVYGLATGSIGLPACNVSRQDAPLRREIDCRLRTNSR